jgi:hypothetical protein
VFNFGVRYVLDGDVVGSFIDYCLHFSALFFYPIPIAAK